MEYIQVARELASIVPTAREAYRDMLWLYGVARATWTPAASSAPEVEMVACFRDCIPLEHDEPVWSTECEYDCEEWVHCGIAEAASEDDHAPRPRYQYPPGLSELCAWSPPHATLSEQLPESTPCLSQAEVPELVAKNTNAGSEVLGLDPPRASS